MKWGFRTLPFLISGALAIVDLNFFNENITKPEDCPNVQYACPDCPSGQQCVYPNSGGCEGAGIPTCQAIDGCFGQVCLMRALPCPKECPFFCEYNGPPCCPFIGQPVCKPVCQTFVACQVTECPDECPDDCFYPNAPTCCPKSGQAVCKNKNNQILTPTEPDVATTENVLPVEPPIYGYPEIEPIITTEYYEPNTYKSYHKKVHYRKNHHDRGAYQNYGRESNGYDHRRGHSRQDHYNHHKHRNQYHNGRSSKYPKFINPKPSTPDYWNQNQWNNYGPEAAIDPLPPIPYNAYPGPEAGLDRSPPMSYEKYPGPEAAIDYFPGYKPSVPKGSCKPTYPGPEAAIDPLPPYYTYPGPEAAIDYFPIPDTKKPYTNGMNDVFKDYPDWRDGNELTPADLDFLPPFYNDPLVVTVTEKVSDCPVSDESSTVDSNIEEASVTHHICPLFIRACPPECPDDCVYPTDAPCPYTMQPSCPSEGQVRLVEESLSNDADDLPLIDSSILGEDLDPSSITELEDVETVLTQPIDIDMENDNLLVALAESDVPIPVTNTSTV